MDGMLDASETSRRLGIKVATLYVYVSRGLIQSHPGPDGRRSFFSVDDVERFASRSRQGRVTESRLATISTSVTRITEEGPQYRGVSAISMMRSTFEEVADHLLQAGPGAWAIYNLKPPDGLDLRDLVRYVVIMTASNDPMRSDRRPGSVVAAARSLIATIVGALPTRSGLMMSPSGSIAKQLAQKLSPDGDGSRWIESINALMVLLADHEVASSTLGVRLAASTRSDLYDAILTGLGIMSGPMHGGHSELIYGLLKRCEEEGVGRTVDDELRWRSFLPGAGLSMYPSGDPRFQAMRPLLEEVLVEPKREIFNSFLEVLSARGLPEPNIDLAIATLAWSLECDATVGPLIFNLSRIVGWAAHYLEELGEEPVRYRCRAIYITPPTTDDSKVRSSSRESARTG